MRIAVCISGEPRSYEICHQSLKNTLKNTNVDYYISTWENCYNNHNKLIDLYNPVKISYEPRQNFTMYHDKIIQTYGINRFSFLGMFDMCYLIKKSIFLINNNKEYDWVIRTRFDLRFSDVDFPFHLLNNDAINFPDVQNYSGYNDQFFVAKKHNMHKIADIFSWLPISISRRIVKVYNPEPILKYYIDTVKNIPVNQFEYKYKLYREDFGNIEKFENIPEHFNKFHEDKKKKFDEYVKTRLSNLKYIRVK